MNIIAIDIGNTNITIGLFLNDEEKFIQSFPGQSEESIADCLKSSWQKIPVVEISKEKKRNGVIVVSSVKPVWTELVRKIAADNLAEKILVIGQNIPVPINLQVDEPEKVGTDRAVCAAAAYAVIEDAVAVADFGTAVTIDLVDEKGIFLGGVICPGFKISAEALNKCTAQLPMVEVTKPAAPYGKNTVEAINAGLYYSAVATLQEVVRLYAEKTGKWPHTIITGSGAKIIKDDCEFVDSYVPNLVIKGIVLAYKNYLEEKME